MLSDADPVDTAKIKQIVEGALMAADGPLSVEKLFTLFRRGELDPAHGKHLIREALRELGEEAAGRAYELKRVASGFRFQVRTELSEWIGRLWEEKPPRYSRALLETLALIAYKQPVTRGEIEQVRGVAVSQGIVRTLLERGWVRVLGQRETPGRPNLYGTTRAFLDYFNLKSLDQLPALPEIKSMVEPLAAEEEGEISRPVGEERAPGEFEARPAAGPDPAADDAAADDAAADDAATADATVADTATAGAAEAGQESAEAGRRLAEVVRLPTATRQAGLPRGE